MGKAYLNLAVYVRTDVLPLGGRLDCRIGGNAGAGSGVFHQFGGTLFEYEHALGDGTAGQERPDRVGLERRVMMGPDVGALVIGEFGVRHQFLLAVRVLVPPGRAAAERRQPDQELRFGTDAAAAAAADIVIRGGRGCGGGGGCPQQYAFFAGHRGLVARRRRLSAVLDHGPILERVDQPPFLFGHLVHEVRVTAAVPERFRRSFSAVPERPGTGRRRIVARRSGRRALARVFRWPVGLGRRRLAVVPFADARRLGGRRLFDDRAGRRFLFELLQSVLDGRGERLGRQRAGLPRRRRPQPRLVLHHELVHQPFQAVGRGGCGGGGRGGLGLGRERRAQFVRGRRRVAVTRQDLVGRQTAGLPRLVNGLGVVRYLFGDGRDILFRLGTRGHHAAVARGSGRAGGPAVTVMVGRRGHGAVALSQLRSDAASIIRAPDANGDGAKVLRPCDVTVSHYQQPLVEHDDSGGSRRSVTGDGTTC